MTTPLDNESGDAEGRGSRAPIDRAPRHLRVGVLIRRASVHVASIWLVDAPATQDIVVGHPILTRVDVASRLAGIALLADPRVARATMKPGAGHHFGLLTEGVCYVSVPFAKAADLLSIRIRLTDLGGIAAPSADVGALAGLIAEPTDAMRPVYELTTKDLRASKDWAAVAGSVGLTGDVEESAGTDFPE